MAGREGRLPESLLREGLAMVQAAAADAVAAGLRVTVLRDMGVPAIAAAGADIRVVDSRTTHDQLVADLAEQSDATLVIAPELDGVLASTVERVTQAGGRLVSPGSDFVRVAADKSITAERLTAAGVATPRSVVVPPDEPLPDGFDYPAVIKPIDGAGSQDTHVVAVADDRPPAYPWPRLLQRYTPGAPVSVAAIGVTGAEPLLLPPCRQRLTGDGRLQYLGGSTPLPAGLAARAHELAAATLAALPPLVGYAGVDLVLGDAPDGSRDTVIEINPRLTTSFVGLRAACRPGLLAAAMLAGAAGEATPLVFDPRPLAFDADGTVYYDRE